MSLFYNGRPQFKSSVQPHPGTEEKDPAPRVVSNDVTDARSVRADGHSDWVRDLQCRVMNFLGFDYCMCHGGWQHKSRMDSKIEGLCHKCGPFVWWDRVAHRVGFTK